MRLKRMRKGQAALEYITTYSWALTVILVTIGAIIYFGVFDASTFMRPYCSLIRELPCDEYTVAQNHVKMQLRNGFERDIQIHEITLVKRDNLQRVTCDVSLEPQSMIIVGKRANFCCAWPSNAFANGEKEPIDFTVTYSRAAIGAAKYNATGSILANAMQASACT